MGEEGPPEDICGYEYNPEELEGEVQQNCCIRGTVPDSDKCVWHVYPGETDYKNVESLKESRSSFEKRKQVGNHRTELLDGAALAKMEIEDEISFENVSLRNADLFYVDLTDAYFHSADLSDAYLRSADLSGANLTLVDLSNVDLSGASLTNANLWEVNATGANFNFADLSDADISKSDLSGADIHTSNLSGANLGNANLADTLLLKSNLVDTDLGNADLTDSDLTGADLTGAHLIFADLVSANLTFADLTDADISDADMNRASLEQSNFTRTNLTGADLRQTKLHGTLLKDVRMDRNTQFGDHYADELNGGTTEDFDKAAWSLRQIQRLFEENAFPKKAREAKIERKDLRRREDWAKSPIPSLIRRVVAAEKRAVGKLERGAKSLVNSSDEEDEKDEDTPKIDRPLEVDEKGDLSDFVSWSRLATSGFVSRYAKSPRRVVGVSLLTIAVFGLLYPFFGGMETSATSSTQYAFYTTTFTVPEQVETFFYNLYFSAVTFTTLGYGDIQPATPATQTLASVQSFLGALLMALLVYVFGRQSTR